MTEEPSERVAATVPSPDENPDTAVIHAAITMSVVGAALILILISADTDWQALLHEGFTAGGAQG